MTARLGITTNRCQIWGELCSGPICLDPILPVCRLDLHFRSVNYVTLAINITRRRLVSLTPVPNKATPLKLLTPHFRVLAKVAKVVTPTLNNVLRLQDSSLQQKSVK